MSISKNILNLRSLIELSHTLSLSESTEFVIKSAVLSLMGKLQVGKAIGLLPVSPGKWKKVAGTALDEGSLVHFPLEGECELDSENLLHKPLLDAGLRHVFFARHNDKTSALLMIGEKLTKGQLSDEEVEYCTLLAGLVANALATVGLTSSLKSESAQLERSNQLLTTLFDVSKEFNALKSAEDIVRVLTYRLLGQLTVSKFSMVLFDEQEHAELIVDRLKLQSTERLEHVFSGLMSPISIQDSDELRPQYLKFMLDHQAQIVVPLFVKNQRSGLLLLGRKMVEGGFTDADKKFIEAIGSVATIALENDRLFQQELRRRAIEEEMKIAKTIQQGLLPSHIPDIQNFDVAASNVSSKDIGGDYYDITIEQDDDLMFVVADVSGKGVPAALLMANMQAAFRTLSPLGLPLEVMVERMNALIFRNTTPDKFVTAFIGVLTPSTGKLRYINAGHNPPIVVRRDLSVEELTHGGLILGIMEQAIPYEVGTIRLHSSDMLYVYTDGVTEAQNCNDAELGEPALIETLRAHRKKSSQEIIKRVHALIREHVQDYPQSDDITMMSFKML